MGLTRNYLHAERNTGTRLYTDDDKVKYHNGAP